MNHTELLTKVMERLQRQFLVPAVFTLKEHPTEERFTEVNVFIHGFGSSFAGSMDFLLEEVAGAKENIRTINVIADYLIHYFIKSIQNEEEENVIFEIVENLAYLYRISVRSQLFLDAENHEGDISRLAAFAIETAEGNYLVTLDSMQMKHEYEGRFDSEESPDILVDLKEIITRLTTDSYENAVAYAKTLDRNILVLDTEETKFLLTDSDNREFYNAMGLSY